MRFDVDQTEGRDCSMAGAGRAWCTLFDAGSELARLNGIAIATALVVCLAIFSNRCAANPHGVPLELEPYRVRVEISFAARPEFPARFREAIVAELRDGLDRSAGAVWQFSVSEDQL